MPRPYVLVPILALATVSPLLADDATPAAPPAAATSKAAPVPAPTALPADLGTRVATAIGRPLTTKPAIVETNAAAIATAVEKDLTAQALASGLDPAGAAAAVDAARPMVASAASRQLAYFSHADRTIFLNADRLEALVAADTIPASLRDQVLALAVARELARATQDQEFPLREFLRMPSAADPSFTAEAATARRAVSEGHASAVATIVGVALADSDPRWLSALQAFERSMPGAVAMPTTAPDVIDAIVYRGGTRRLEGAFRAGGPAAAWALFRAPPSTNSGFDLTLIAYDADLSASIAAALQPAVGQFGKEWAGQSMKNTPAAAFGSQLNRMDAATRNAYLGSVEGIASLAATSSAGTRLMLSVTKALDGVGADLVWDELGKMNAFVVTNMPADPPSSEEKTVNGVRSEAARILMKNGASQIPATVCRMRDGEWLVQMSYLNGEPTFDRVREIGTIAIEAAKRWETATATPPSPTPAPATPSR